MARTLSDTSITTATARSKLAPGQYPRRLDADAAIFYRKGKRAGVWFARWRNNGPGAAYRQTQIGAANDLNDKQVEGLLTFLQAERVARQIVEQARARARAAAEGPVLTVGAAVEHYSAIRDEREARRAGRPRRSDARQRLGRYVLGQASRDRDNAPAAAPLAAIELHALKERDLVDWRSSLPQLLKATTRQRLINDLKAALNGAYSANRDRLPPTVPAVIKHGLRAGACDDAAESGVRENQILSDAEVARLILASREIDLEQDWEGDLFRFVLVLAATGARFSQVARMRVADLQIDASRMLMPVSRKGRGGKVGTVTIPVGRDVVEALAGVASSRPSDAPLLERWRSIQAKGEIAWTRDRRGAWQSSAELARPWRVIRERAGIPNAIPYALRHSSIVKGIRANLPIRLVAALHDTSTAMIERHYSRFIADGLEDLARSAIVPLIVQRGIRSNTSKYASG